MDGRRTAVLAAVVGHGRLYGVLEVREAVRWRYHRLVARHRICVDQVTRRSHRGGISCVLSLPLRHEALGGVDHDQAEPEEERHDEDDEHKSLAVLAFEIEFSHWGVRKTGRHSTKSRPSRA